MDKNRAKEKLNEKMSKMIDRWGLRYNFGSIYYCLELEGVSLEQCASCYFFGDSGSDEDMFRSVERATKILITAGLYDYDKRNYEEASEKAVKCINEWQKKFGNVIMLHMTLIGILKNRDFFSESLTTVTDIATRLNNICQAMNKEKKKAEQARAWVKAKMASMSA